MENFGLRLRCHSLMMLGSLRAQARGALSRLQKNSFVFDDTFGASSMVTAMSLADN